MLREIEMKNVSSSIMRSIGYDEDISDLYVEFTNGKVYRYSEVPKFEYDRLLKAPSTGKHFQAEIKGVFECERINEIIGEGNILKIEPDYPDVEAITGESFSDH